MEYDEDHGVVGSHINGVDEMRSWFARHHRKFDRLFAGEREQERGLARRTARSGACVVVLAIGVMVSWGCASQNVGDPQAQIMMGRYMTTLIVVHYP